MERLTKRRQDGRVGFAVSGTPSENMCKFPIVLDKLGEYEDLEEDGRLIRLPCKVGDKVWINYHDFIYESSVSGFFVEKNRTIVEFECCRPFPAASATNFGKTIFLSYEEAERSLVKS